MKAEGDEMSEGSRPVPGTSPAHQGPPRIFNAATVDESWRDLGRRFRVLWILLFASLPGAFLTAWLLNAMIDPNASLVVLGLAWTTAIALAGRRVAHFACPRCGSAFFENWYFLKMFRDNCAQCDLPRDACYTPPPVAGD